MSKHSSLGILQKYHNKLDMIEKNNQNKLNEPSDNKRAKSYQDPEKESSFEKSDRRIYEREI